jgi:glutamate decarboxylase
VGYTRIFANLRHIAARLAAGVLAIPDTFRLISDSHSLPLVAFSFLPRSDGTARQYDEFQLSDKLKERGWVLPAYRMAPQASHVLLVRAVIREDFSMAMCDALVKDIAKAVLYLEHFHGSSGGAPQAAAPASEADAASAAPPTQSASWNAKHAAHRVHVRGKKHSGVC